MNVPSTASVTTVAQWAAALLDGDGAPAMLSDIDAILD
jgi:hypothetical protein